MENIISMCYIWYNTWGSSTSENHQENQQNFQLISLGGERYPSNCLMTWKATNKMQFEEYGH